MAYRNYSIVNGFTVSKSIGEGDFTTIAAATAAAVSGQTIAIADGFYVENFTAKAGVTYTAMSGDQYIGNVQINGTVTITGAGGSYSFAAINFVPPNAGYSVSITATGAFVGFDTCNCFAINGTFLFSNTSSTSFYMKNCTCSANNNNTVCIITNTGQSYIQNCNFYNVATAGYSSIAAGTLIIENSGSGISFRSTGSGIIRVNFSTVNTSLQNVEALVFNSSDTVFTSVINSYINSGTASAIDIISGDVIVTNNTITSSNTNAITGAGTLSFGGNIFTSSTGVNTSTINSFPLSERQGGSQASSLTGILVGNGTSPFTAITTANSGVLSTSSSGVPTIDTTNFAVLTTGLQLKGNNTNTAPPAGFIGQQIISVIGSGSAVTLSNSVAANIASISVTAGVWDIVGYINYANAAITGTSVTISLNTTSATLGTLGDTRLDFPAVPIAASNLGLTLPPWRRLFSTTTTVYLVAYAAFTAGTLQAYGKISAVRVG